MTRSCGTSPAFEPTIRDERMYARGATDDKGNFLPLLHIACELASAGELPVHVRVLIEGAEETGSDDVGDWVLSGRARRRRRDRLRQRHGRRPDPRADARDPWHGLRPPRGPHRHPARALGHVRRRRAERLPRPPQGAGRGPSRAGRQAAPSRCAPGSSRPRRPRSTAGRRCPTARGELGRRRRPPRRRGAPRPSSTSARPPSRRSTSTRSWAGRRGRSASPSPARICPCGSSAASARRRSRATSRSCCATTCPTAPS